MSAFWKILIENVIRAVLVVLVMILLHLLGIEPDAINDIFGVLIGLI